MSPTANFSLIPCKGLANKKFLEVQKPFYKKVLTHRQYA
jgi:hypothetical protein